MFCNILNALSLHCKVAEQQNALLTVTAVSSVYDKIVKYETKCTDNCRNYLKSNIRYLT